MVLCATQQWISLLYIFLFVLHMGGILSVANCAQEPVLPAITSTSSTPNVYVRLLILELSSNITLPCLIVSRLNKDAITQSSWVASSIDNIPEIELQALQDLFNATNGEGWEFGQNFGNPWNFSADANPCLDYWEGVTCTSTASSDGYLHVEILYLTYYGLNGSIPNTIGNLAQLVNLSLVGNLLSGGGLPESLCNLTQLQVLQVSHSKLRDSLPAAIGTMTSLVNMQVDHNHITGTVPEGICDLVRLELLFADNCLLEGFLPDCISRLTAMRYFSFQYNFLTGTLPDGIGNMKNLTILDISDNKLHGTVPPGLGALVEMQQLFLYQNAFSGRVLDYVVNMVDLVYLDMSYNRFTGTIPARIGDLVSLSTLITDGNVLSGTIPPSITQLPLLSQLTFTASILTGTIPADMFLLPSLVYMSVEYNMLSGPVPPSLQQSTSIAQVVLGVNHLTGTLPDTFASATQLDVFLAYDNLLTGTLPFGLLSLHLLALELGSNLLTGQIPVVEKVNNSRMFYLDMGDNYLTGPFPDIFGHPTIMGYLNLSSNWLTGTLPAASIANFQDMNFLYLESNLFSEALPDVWDELFSLSYLFLNDNLFTGSISASLGAAPYLRSLNLSQNFFSGSIPRALSNASALNVLLLQQNALTGNLDGLFDPSMQRILVTVQVSGNRLSGTLPDVLSKLPALQTFAAVSNCFTGSIPLSLFGSGSLVTLALDGLQSATSCQRHLFPASLEGSVVANSLYLIRSPLVGGVPSCLFGMGNLTTLHLSGNGLTGGLSNNLSISAALTDLSLSHNKLTGSIPASMLEHSWTNLDLSYNRFGGTLQDRQPAAALPNTTLYLGNNRLSGRIPAALVQMANVDILQSNLFSCRADRSDLPHHDPNKGKFDCASVVLDETLYAWLSAISAGAVLVVMLRYGGGRLDEWRRAALAQVKLWWSAASAERAPHCRSVCLSVTAVVRIAVACCAYALVVLLPMYAVCSALYGTYAHQYAWAVSAAYLSGRVAFAWEFACLALLGVAALLAAVLAFRATITDDHLLNKVLASAKTPTEQAEGIFAYGLAIVVNFAVVVGVNTAYVIIALNENGKALTLAQIALALFKVAFNSVCSPVLMRWLSQSVLGRQPSAAGFITVQLFVSMVNNILVPCLVVSIISPDCFYNIFKTASVVVAHFEYGGRCVTYDPYSRALYGCGSVEILTAYTSYSPPFNYSYQCSSSFITYYAPAYVIMCIIAGIALPLAQLLLQWLHGRAVRGTRWFTLLDAALPRLLKPMIADASDDSAAVGSPHVPYFDASQHLITLLTYLALLLTFGAVFPPLAVCFAVTMLCMAGFTRLKMGRFLFNAHAQGLTGCAAAVEQDCSGVGGTGLLRRSVGMVVSFSCLFYTLFLFDTLGDAQGLSGAYWVLIVVPLLVASGGLAAYLVSQLSGRKGRARDEGKPEPGAVEMPTRSPLAAPASAADDAL